MPKPSIFISHSAKEPEAEELLRRICERLRMDFDPYVADEKMRRGTDYKDELAVRLLSCRGAILLLSPTALDSDWVRTEAELLDARRRTEGDDFTFLPYLVAGADREALEKSPLGKLKMTALHLPRTTTDAAVDEIMSTLTARYRPPGPFHRLEVTISALLADGLQDSNLQLAAEALELDIECWSPHDKYLAVARQLLQAELVKFERAMEQIYVALRNPVAVVDRVLPFTWIDPEAVRPLREAAAPQASRPPMAINSTRATTGRWYVRRACPEPECWIVAETVSPEHESYDVALGREVRRVILDLLRYDEFDVVSDAELATELGEHEQAKGPVFVLLPAPADHITVAALRQQFPTVIFLILAGPEAVEQHLPSGITLLTPLLDPQVESRSHRVYRRLTERAPVGRRATSQVVEGLIR